MIWLPGTPTYPSIRPKMPIWKELDRESSERIQQWTAFQGIVSKMENAAPDPFGYYKIDTSNDSFFVKIIEQAKERRQIQSNHLAQWLKQHGIGVSCILYGFPKKIKNSSYKIFAYKMIDGRFCRPIKHEIALLGTSLGDLHRALSNCPWKKQIKKNGMSRHNSLKELLIEIQSGRSQVKAPSRVLALLSGIDPTSLDILTISPQVVHGDLNYGNLLIGKMQSEVFFLDFEDTWTAWFSPLMELSFVIERFTLLEDDAKSMMLTQTLKNAYLSKGGKWFSDSKQLGSFLRVLSMRALLVLIMIRQQNSTLVSKSEWEKFLKLYYQAIHRSDLISRLSEM